MIKYIFFDVSGTLLGKPILFAKIQDVLKDFGYTNTIEEIKYKHKLLSEVIHFPDRTDEEFYNKFNIQLLYSLGIVPNKKILTNIFNKCTYLPWEAYSDTKVLSEIDLPLGVISNFNTTLKDKLSSFFGSVFHDILVSEELGVSKPNIAFYNKALEAIDMDASEVLYIGDSIRLDLEPAKKVGFNTLIVDRDEFYTKSQNIIYSLEEIKQYL